MPPTPVELLIYVADWPWVRHTSAGFGHLKEQGAESNHARF